MDMPERGSTDGLASPGDRSARTKVRGAVMFWVLIVLAAAGFVPAIMLPIWRDYQAMALAAQAEERLVAPLRSEVQRQRRVLEAIRTDPGVNARLAQRELAYRRPDQREIPLPGVPASTTALIVEPLEAVEPPLPATRLLGRLPAANYDQLFCHGPTRMVIILLSGGLVVAAFALYSRSPGPEATGQDRPTG